MKNVTMGIAVCFTILILFSCQQFNTNDKQQIAEKNMISTEKLDTNQRQFIHTASLDMAVNNCLQATALIEQQAISYKGFVLKSNVNKNINQQVESIMNADSIKQLTYYNTIASIIVRVPDTSLHSFLQYTQGLSTHVKTRLIDAEDVSFDLKLNQLNIKTGDKQQAVVATNGEDKIEIKKLTNNESIVQNMIMKDAIHFSTVSISLQQPEEILSTIMINRNAGWAKETSILNKVWYSLQKGFYYFTSIVIFLLQMWWVIPFYLVGKFIYTKTKRSFASKVKSSF